MTDRNSKLLRGISLIVLCFVSLLIVGSGPLEIELTSAHKITLCAVQVLAVTVFFVTSIYKNRGA